jgi:hypothetical protein
MSPEALVLGRNLALILLAIEAIVIFIPLLIVPLYAVRYLPRLRAPIRPRLLQIRVRVQQVEKTTKLVSSAVVQPFLWVVAVMDGLKRGLAYLLRRR